MGLTAPSKGVPCRCRKRPCLRLTKLFLRATGSTPNSSGATCSRCAGGHWWLSGATSGPRCSSAESASSSSSPVERKWRASRQARSSTGRCTCGSVAGPGDPGFRPKMCRGVPLFAPRLLRFCILDGFVYIRLVKLYSAGHYQVGRRSWVLRRLRRGWRFLSLFF